jgi:hypothetical protein
MSAPCAERRASVAAGSGSAADAGGSQLQAVVRQGHPTALWALTPTTPHRAGLALGGDDLQVRTWHY